MQIDDGRAGEFSSVLGGGLDTPAEMTLETYVRVNNLIKGAVYRVRYRAINSIGYGPWSDVTYARVAQVPQPPPKPTVTSVDETQIELALSMSADNGGTVITAYHLYINEGSNGSTMHEITDYDNVSGTYTVLVGDLVGTHTVSVGNTY